MVRASGNWHRKAGWVGFVAVAVCGAALAATWSADGQARAGDLDEAKVARNIQISNAMTQVRRDAVWALLRNDITLGEAVGRFCALGACDEHAARALGAMYPGMANEELYFRQILSYVTAELCDRPDVEKETTRLLEQEYRRLRAANSRKQDVA